MWIYILSLKLSSWAQIYDNIGFCQNASETLLEHLKSECVGDFAAFWNSTIDDKRSFLLICDVIRLPPFENMQLLNCSKFIRPPDLMIYHFQPWVYPAGLAVPSKIYFVMATVEHFTITEGNNKGQVVMLDKEEVRLFGIIYFCKYFFHFVA